MSLTAGYQFWDVRITMQSSICTWAMFMHFPSQTANQNGQKAIMMKHEIRFFQYMEQIFLDYSQSQIPNQLTNITTEPAIFCRHFPGMIDHLRAGALLKSFGAGFPGISAVVITSTSRMTDGFCSRQVVSKTTRPGKMEVLMGKP